jgi:hypothetical protein
VTDITELAPGRNNEVIRSELCSAIAFRRVAIRSGFLRCWCLAALAALMPLGADQRQQFTKPGVAEPHAGPSDDPDSARDELGGRAHLADAEMSADCAAEEASYQNCPQNRSTGHSVKDGERYLSITPKLRASVIGKPVASISACNLVGKNKVAPASASRIATVNVLNT